MIDTDQYLLVDSNNRYTQNHKITIDNNKENQEFFLFAHPYAFSKMLKAQYPYEIIKLGSVYYVKNTSDTTLKKLKIDINPISESGNEYKIDIISD